MGFWFLLKIEFRFNLDIDFIQDDSQMLGSLICC
jgi:hypothetical protein